MKDPDLAIRTALVSALDGIIYLTKTIAVFEEDLQETSTRKKAILTIGNQQVEAYILLTNQTSNDTSAKCLRADQVSIQIQITTVWPANKGGSKVAEEIGELVTGKLFTTDGLFTTLETALPINVWMGELAERRNIKYDTTSSKVWIKNLFLIFQTTQY